MVHLAGTHGVAAPVHGQRDAGAEAGRVRGEEGDGGRHLLHFARPPHRVGRLGAASRTDVQTGDY